MDETEVVPEEVDGDGDNGGGGGIQSRMMNIPPNYTGYGWNGGGGVGGYMPQPPVPTAPYPGGDGGIYPPPPGGGGALYPNIGFNPSLIAPAPGGRYMECPICQRMLSPPIYQCESGHTLCNVCIDRLDYCTQNDCMCPLEGPKIRNIALEQMCQGHHHIVRVSCPNESEGCSAVVARDHLSEHLQVCEFGGIPFCSKYLGLLGCAERVTRFSLVSHLCECHQVEETEQSKFILKLLAPTSALHLTTAPNQQGVVWSPIVIKSDHLDGDRVLVKCFVSPRGYLTLAGYLLPNSSDPEWKRYRIKFQIESVSKVARLEWTGRLIFHHFNQTIIMNQPGQTVSNVNTFRIPLHSLSEYVKPTNSHDEALASSKLKIKVCVWKQANEGPSFREPFINFETGEDENSPEKLTLLSQFSGDALSFTAVDDVGEEHHHPYHLGAPRMTSTVQYGQEEYTNYYSLDASCNQCTRPLYGDVIYQCLQCPSEGPATYFCRDCIERANSHVEHLTIRIAKPSLQPLAAVAFECSAGELQ